MRIPKMTRVAALAVLAAVAVSAGCSGDDDDGGGGDDVSNVESEPDAGADTDADAADDADTTGDQAPVPAETAPPGSGRGSATLELDNGESFEFGELLCALEPQQSVGSEILFSAVSYGDPGLDVTQFGSEGTVTGVATISVYDAGYETIWDAQSVYEAFGGSIELSLDGTTITGDATFFPAGDIEAEPVAGTLVANC